MKSRKISCSLILLSVILLSFINKNEIKECYISFKSASNLTAADPDKLPENSEKFRIVPTSKGNVEITRADGYRILYKNEKMAPFVNLKVELSKDKFYEKDQKNLIENLKYMNSNSEGMESKNLNELEFNGYKIYGLSRGTIESGSTLGTFVMFPGNGIVVYFYFNNLKPEYRNFESVDDYKTQRDKFLDEYTKHLNSCK